MKHALLVGVPSTGLGALNPVPNLSQMARLLADLGGWSVETLPAEDTTREGVLAAIERRVAACQPRDACLFYFFGHGGVVRFSGLTGHLGQRAVFYLATLRPLGSPMVGVLDFEISEALTRLDRVCGNVTAILDCCHAASIVRDFDIPTIVPPPWAIALAQREQARTHRLAAVSHPGIVRLFGSSSLRSAYAKLEPDGHHGRLTRGFVNVLHEAELRCDRLSWDTVAHRVREQVNQTVGTEDQRVVLAGPRQRLLFSSETVVLPRSVAFIPGTSSKVGWIRAGLLQGVETGDHWSIAALTLGDELQPRFIAEARVGRVELDRSEVALSSEFRGDIAAGSTAIQRTFERRAKVAVEASESLTEAIEASGLLQVVPIDSPAVIARVRERSGTAQVEVSDVAGRVRWTSPSADDTGSRSLLELLEDRARAQRLLADLGSNATTALRDGTIDWRWGRISNEQRIELPRTTGLGAPSLHVGDRLWIELVHRGSPPPHWFASVVEIGVEGRPQLLNAHEPEGMEVVPGVPVCVGLRAHRRHPGLALYWPRRTPTDEGLLVSLIMLASRRPFSLGHITVHPHSNDPEALMVQGLLEGSAGPTRSGTARPPVASLAWTYERVDFVLFPHPRDGTPRS